MNSPSAHSFPPPRRKRVLAQLKIVCDKIEAILAGQDVTLEDFPLVLSPGETKLERLQRFKGRLQSVLADIDRGEPRLCSACASPIDERELDEMPWAETCARCAAAGA